MQDPAEVAAAYLDVARSERALEGADENYARANAALSLLSDIQRRYGIRDQSSDIRLNAAKELLRQIAAACEAAAPPRSTTTDSVER